MENYYVIAKGINKFKGKFVVFPPRDTVDECNEDIVKYDKMDNKTEQRFEYIIVEPIKEQ